MCYYLKEKQIGPALINKNYKYYKSIKELYFILLSENVEFILLLFFLLQDKSLAFYNKSNNSFYKDLQVV